MRDIYLGDSFDLVKRFWFDNLFSVAPLFAHPKFVPPEIRDQYTTLTKIPILDFDSLPDDPFGIFLDPHTGIPLPTDLLEGATLSHASLPFIVRTNRKYHPRYMICFDQSYHRRHQLTTDGQREAKRGFLREQGIASFYYISHATFLFMAEKKATIIAIRDRLIKLGIPEKTPKTIRLQVIEP